MSAKELVKKILPRTFFEFVRDVVYPEKINILEERMNGLCNTYYHNIAAPEVSQRTVFRNAEFKIFSKHGCDGILLYIFSKIGVHNYTFVEIGVEDGRECNTRNLSVNFGWKGLLVDANTEWVASAQEFYRKTLEGNVERVRVVDSFVTAENINSLLHDNHIEGEIDLLSIDIDSNDYWVWKSVATINPRVVVIEYNAAFGDSRSLTITYDPHFYKQQDRENHPLYSGASLEALAKLGVQKGYILVACDSHGHDAYFVRKDIVEGKFIQMSAKAAFYANPYILNTVGDTEAQFDLIKHLPLDEV